MKSICLTLLLMTGICMSGLLYAQEKVIVNDSNTPLHLLTPAHKNPYKELTKEEIKITLDRVKNYLERATSTRVVNKETGQEVTDYSRIDQLSQLERGDFRLGSYEWGVTYSGMLETAKATGDKTYYSYVKDRFTFLSMMVPHFKRLMTEHNVIDPQMRQIISPHALDDSGAMCAAMIKYQQETPGSDMRSLIDNYMDYIMNKEYRLADGTFARMRPQMNTLWLDDLYMSVPAIIRMGALTGEQRYFDEAVKQIRQFSERMFVKEKGLYMHGWVEAAEEHPAFHWARANGWALLTMTEVLDVLPETHPGREFVLMQYKMHVKGLAALQSSEGFWHQLLDRNDSYLETSATAIYVYCIARGVNKGWLDAVSYGPVAHLGWNAVSTQVNEEGQVEGTCVGTGMAFDPAFYYYRPVNKYAAHGYGPILLAGAEMIHILNRFYPRMNDSAIQYYTNPPKTDAPIFGVGGTTLF